MKKFITDFLSNPVEAIYFLFPFLSVILYSKMRRRIGSNRISNLVIGFLMILGFSLLLFCIYGAVFALLINFNLISLPDPIEIFIKYSIFVLIISITLSSLERQDFLRRNVVGIGKKEEKAIMKSSVKRISKAARQEIWMFCGTMSFFNEEKKYLQKITKKCKIKALCLKSNKKSVVERYQEARKIGIRIKFYPNKSYDKGIRARIIDPKHRLNSNAILIKKEMSKGKLKEITYLVNCINNPYLLTYLDDIFELIWKNAG